MLEKPAGMVDSPARPPVSEPGMVEKPPRPPVRAMLVGAASGAGRTYCGTGRSLERLRLRERGE